MARLGTSAALALGAGCAFLARLADQALAPEAGEPLLLRWVRAAADHPVRTAAAAACLALALRPGPPRDPPGSEQDERPPRMLELPPLQPGLERGQRPAPPFPGPFPHQYGIHRPC
jgi:hypothetical protein